MRAWSAGLASDRRPSTGAQTVLSCVCTFALSACRRCTIAYLACEHEHPQLRLPLTRLDLEVCRVQGSTAEGGCAGVRVPGLASDCVLCQRRSAGSHRRHAAGLSAERACATPLQPGLLNDAHNIFEHQFFVISRAQLLNIVHRLILSRRLTIQQGRQDVVYPIRTSDFPDRV